MHIHVYALYIETCIISNMHIHVYAWYIAFRQGVRIPDEGNGGPWEPGNPAVSFRDSLVVYGY